MPATGGVYRGRGRSRERERGAGERLKMLRPAAHLASLPGVVAVSSVYRTTAAVTQDEGGSPVDVLAC